MQEVKISVGSIIFIARMEEKKAPKTCQAFKELLPFKNKIIQARWSGEAAWIPLGDLNLNVGFENHTSHPSRGDILFYPGGYSETEILLVYGSCAFSSKLGTLAGNYFLTIIKGNEKLLEFGNKVLYEGAQDILIELLDK